MQNIACMYSDSFDETYAMSFQHSYSCFLIFFYNNTSLPQQLLPKVLILLIKWTKEVK